MGVANDKLGRFIATSAVLHGALVAAVVFIPALFPEQTVANWGSPTSTGVKVGSTNSLPGIPLPSPPAVSETAKGNDSDTLNPAELAPKPVEKVPDVADVKVPSATKKPEPKSSGPTKVARGKPEPDAPPPSNAIPGQATGQVALPYSDAGGAGGTATFGDATFGTRFPDYVARMKNAINEQWQRPPNVPAGTRVYVLFTIPKQGGRVGTVEVEKPSGSVPMDNSAKRAVLTASMPSLPREYSGSSIDVRFYFEYTR
ncbi:MAG TPA: TonB C-terminal domain-containing protein [Terriglobia bacterium]|nr:TonB C-terminal domain-containing protein [Terriglobia bacterium]